MKIYREDGVAREDDPRFQRSRRILRAAVVDLSQKNPESLTVSAVCEATGIDRATFYRHFPDMEHLVADTLGALADEAAVTWERSSDSSGLQSDVSLAILSQYFAHIEANWALYQWALGRRGSAAALHAVVDRMTDSVQTELRLLTGSGDTPEIRRRAGFAAGALLGTILTWLADPHPTPSAELAQWVVYEVDARLMPPTRTHARG